MKFSVVLPDSHAPFEARVAEIFCEEVALRTGIQPEVCRMPPADGSYLTACTLHTLKEAFPDLYSRVAAMERPGPEGFCLSVEKQGDTVQIVVGGLDDRGCLFGMGRVLRKLHLSPGTIKPTDGLRDTSVTPRYPLRGHQLAYRDKQNTCPTWDIPQFDRYIRDLALFGSNAVEILPPRTDDALFSAHFPRDPFEMMVALSRVIHSYGMDVWMWYPNMGDNYKAPGVFQRELLERERVFSGIPYVDAVLIPAGDPGELAPKELFPVTKASVDILHRYHPHARVWIAPQVFHPAPGWYDDFYAEVDKEPEWLYGICFAPWEQDTIQELHARLPEIYRGRIRHYPDITHSSHSQFEMPDWDMAFALTMGREGNNTRPQAMKHIHNYHAPYTIGSISYSEGIHDDVNKMVWGDQDFDPARPVEETLEDYARLFIDPENAEELARLLLDTERNWVGPIEENEGIDRVRDGFLALEQKLPETAREGYRFQMALQRALCDYAIKQRALRDRTLERQALAALAGAPATGSLEAIRRARELLRRSFDEPVAEAEQIRIQQLADSLRAGCGIRQTTLRHGAQSWIRGAHLDSMDTPLNDYQWYMLHFRRICKLPDEEQRLGLLEQLVHRTDPGEGGFYDWLGGPTSFARRVSNRVAWEDDPGFLRSPVVTHDPYGIQMRMHRTMGWHDEIPLTLRWVGRARVLYGTPLKVRYEGLQPDRNYRLRIAYPDLVGSRRPYHCGACLWAGDVLLHDRLDVTENMEDPVLEFTLPPASYADGTLQLTWQMKDVLYPLCVSELWIMPVRREKENGEMD